MLDCRTGSSASCTSCLWTHHGAAEVLSGAAVGVCQLPWHGMMAVELVCLPLGRQKEHVWARL